MYVLFDANGNEIILNYISMIQQLIDFQIQNRWFFTSYTKNLYQKLAPNMP